MRAWLGEDDPRAQELIAEIYRQYNELRQEGKQPTRVLLPGSWIRRLRVYHALMGVADNPAGEYLGWDSIFGMEFFVHGERSILDFRNNQTGL